MRAKLARGNRAAIWLACLVGASIVVLPATAAAGPQADTPLAVNPDHEVGLVTTTWGLAVSSDTSPSSPYWVAAKPSLRVRSGPGTGYAQVGSLAYGTHINIACQDYGQNVGGSTIWDRLPSGGWVSDYWVEGTRYAQFTPGLARCSTAESREDRAIAWARAQLGQTHQPTGQPWNGWCDRFVANAYGRSSSGYTTAAAHYQDLESRGLIHHGNTNVPAGALAFSGGNSSAGHVMLSIGGGRFITTAEQVKEVGLSFGGAYWGWSWANPEWPGR